MNRKHILMLAVTLAMASVNARAQSELGSTKTEKAFSSDYVKAVDAAFPRYEDAGLQKRLDALLQKYPTGRDTLRIWQLDQLERVMSLPRVAKPGQTRINLPDREYGADRARGRVFLFRKPERMKPVSPAQMNELQPRISAFHDEVLTRIGIPEEQVFHKRSEHMVEQGTTDPSRGGPQKTQLAARGVRTYALRAVEGILVDGSSATLVSQAPGRITSLDVKWPPVVFPPKVKTMAVRSRDQVREAITAKVRQRAGGAKVDVKMAVVLRRVQAGDQRYYVSAMKVGMRTEGEGEGVIFYESLTDQPLVERESESDTPSGGGE